MNQHGRDAGPVRVVVVGAGISGLAAAFVVSRQRPDLDVVVLEASAEVGGKLRRAEVGGVSVDVGAEAMLARRPEALELAVAAGLEDRLVHAETSAASVWSRGAMHPMPRSVLGVPVGMRSLADSGLLSRRGLARAAMERLLPATDIGDTDVSVGWLIEQRLGREVLDRLVEPLLGGVYAGHARELSARAAAPQVVALLGRDRSLTRAAAATATPPGGPVFAGLVGGVASLATALARGSSPSPRIDVRLGTTVRELARTSQGRWRVTTGSAAEPATLDADAVVVATPGPPAARLLTSCAPAAAAELAQIEYASMAVVTLAFDADAFPEVPGSGFLVPPVDGRRVKAATYSSAKWRWVRDAAPGIRLLRTSHGRHREEQDLQVADEELVAQSLADLADAVGVAAAPVDWHVQRWGGALPQYAVGHLDRVRRVRQSVAAKPGLAVCGAAYDGIGIPACIASAEKAARQVLESLPSTGGVPADGRVEDGRTMTS